MYFYATTYLICQEKFTKVKLRKNYFVILFDSLYNFLTIFYRKVILKSRGLINKISNFRYKEKEWVF